jgi:hypothetical protein
MALGDAKRFVSKHCSYQRSNRDGRRLISDESDVFEENHPKHPSLDTKMTLLLATRRDSTANPVRRAIAFRQQDGDLERPWDRRDEMGIQQILCRHNEKEGAVLSRDSRVGVDHSLTQYCLLCKFYGACGPEIRHFQLHNMGVQG